MWAIMCVCHHVCHTQARPCLSTGWALNRCFAWFFGTVAVLVQGGGGVTLFLNDREQCHVHLSSAFPHCAANASPLACTLLVFCGHGGYSSARRLCWRRLLSTSTSSSLSVPRSIACLTEILWHAALCFVLFMLGHSTGLYILDLPCVAAGTIFRCLCHHKDICCPQMLPCFV